MHVRRPNGIQNNAFLMLKTKHKIQKTEPWKAANELLNLSHINAIEMLLKLSMPSHMLQTCVVLVKEVKSSKFKVILKYFFFVYSLICFVCLKCISIQLKVLDCFCLHTHCDPLKQQTNQKLLKVHTFTHTHTYGLSNSLLQFDFRPLKL